MPSVTHKLMPNTIGVVYKRQELCDWEGRMECQDKDLIWHERRIDSWHLAQ